MKFNFYNDIYKDAVIRSGINALNGVHRSISNGRKGLESDRECDIYTALYGGMHYYKLLDAFNNGQINLNNKKNIDIIDYGCGQAFGTIILLQHLLSKGHSFNGINIKLIDISKIAMNAGKKNIEKLLKSYGYTKSSDANSKKYTIDIMEYSLNEIGNLKHIYKIDLSNNVERLEKDKNKDNYKIHIFSNILDIQTISLRPITNYIKSNYLGDNYFVCVSPNYPYNYSKMEKLQKLFENDCKESKLVRTTTTTLRKSYYRFIGSRQLKYHPITRMERQFYIKF